MGNLTSAASGRCYPANAALQPQDGKQHWETTGIQLLNELLSRDVVVGGGGRQVVLVGHSMGGLILKQVVYEAHHRATTLPANTPNGGKARRFMAHLRGLVFYATPHVGSFPEVWPKWALANNDIALEVTGRPNKEFLDRLEVFDKSTHMLQGRVNNILNEKVQALCFAEQLPMEQSTFGFHTIVEQASAALNPAAGAQFVQADHSGVCKPSSRTQISYTALVEYVEAVIEQQAAVLGQPATQTQELDPML